MEEKKERSYEKEKFKTEPSGIRFNIEHLKFALARSRKKTKQQLVDFLLEQYVKGENPIIERQQQVYDTPPIKVDYDEPKQWQEPKEVVYKNRDYFFNKIYAVKDIDNCRELDAEIRSSDLLPNEKKGLIETLVTHSKTLYND